MAARRSQGGDLATEQEACIRELFRRFRTNRDARDQALALYVNSKLFPHVSGSLEQLVMAACSQSPAAWRAFAMLKHRAAVWADKERRRGRGVDEEAGEDAGSSLPSIPTSLPPAPSPNPLEALFGLFAQHAIRTFAAEIASYRTLLASADLRSPAAWFSVARSMPRRIVYHAGPTNSGKTYNALQALKKAQTGAYCGPLRLLAMEVYDAFNAEGVYCDLITGQERRCVPGSRHVSCTVEMLDSSTPMDVVVLDEIQMIGDQARGWAWTRALLGAPASEIHLCGDGSALGLVAQLAQVCGDAFEVHRYQRFGKLAVEEAALETRGGYKCLAPGDCVVAFSRRDIYDIKALIETSTAYKACVVYGALPPETRRAQARLFNDPDSDYKLLVASDAVGMGLNLNIARMVFHSLRKWSPGTGLAPVPSTQIKQIAGRAGRRSSDYAARGRATCVLAEDVPVLQAALAEVFTEQDTPQAGLFPEFEHLELFAGKQPDLPFDQLLQDFALAAKLDSNFFLCNQESVMGAAALLSHLPLSLKDRYNFCLAPASTRDPRIAAALLRFAARYARGEPVSWEVSPPPRLPRNAEELSHLEAAHQVVSLWLWLSHRFEEHAFPGREAAEKVVDQLCEQMDGGLAALTERSKQARSRAGPERVGVAFSEILGAFAAEEREIAAQKQVEKRRLARAREEEEGGERRRRKRRGRKDREREEEGGGGETRRDRQARRRAVLG